MRGGSTSGHWHTACVVTPTAAATSAVVPPNRRIASDLSMTTVNHAFRENASMVLGHLSNLAFMSPFGERLLQCLEFAGKDRNELAAALGISRQAVGQAIKEGKFSAANTAKTARYLGVNWYWLATGDETMAVSEVAGLTAQERAVLARLIDAAPATPEQRPGGLRLTAAQDTRRQKEALGIDPWAGTHQDDRPRSRQVLTPAQTERRQNKQSMGRRKTDKKA